MRKAYWQYLAHVIPKSTTSTRESGQLRREHRDERSQGPLDLSPSGLLELRPVVDVTTQGY